MPLKCDVSKPLHDESEIISNVAEPDDENVASKEPPRLCNDGDFGITRVAVAAETAKQGDDDKGQDNDDENGDDEDKDFGVFIYCLDVYDIDDDDDE